MGKNAAGVSEDTTRHMLQLQAEVAELRRTVKHLRQSEALYHDMVETSQDLIWRCDAEGRYTYLNPAWEQVLGYQLDEMLGKRFSDFQRPEMAARDQELFSRLMQGNSVKGYESIHIGKSGKEIHLVFNAKFLTDENGTACGTHGTAYDITERKQAEEALRSSESFRKRVFDSSRIPMVVLDIDSLRFIDCNQAAVDAYGLSSREETLGRMPWEVSA
ncbi:MAG: PAS domain-containing protein, partial [Thermodesulfobacteriota bacterium]